MITGRAVRAPVGGRIVATGAPRDVAGATGSRTAAYLAKALRTG
ncbi:hypothetical protein [Streptomyces sp. NPDC057428]